MKRKYFVFVLLSVLIVFLSPPAMAASSKFVRAYRDGNYDMYLKRANIIENQGVLSFWIKCMYSAEGKALVRNELPRKHHKAPIEYGMDYFVYDTNKGKYNIKISTIHANDKEIYREGSKKWQQPKEGTIAAVLIDQAKQYLEEKK